jgi:hypothetical protein
MRGFILSFAALALFNTAAMAAEAEPTGSIAGAADGGAQIVVTNLSTGEIIGIMAKCDGTYRAASLKPGRYSIVEGGPHHAVRTLSVTAGAESQVDLAPESSRGKCAAKDRN